jgi:hypothetical protein
MSFASFVNAASFVAAGVVPLEDDVDSGLQPPASKDMANSMITTA